MSDPLPLLPAVSLTTGVVDVWVLDLDLPLEERHALTAPLDDPERTQWTRMRAGGDRWAVARGARRHVLASYLGVAPSKLRFGRGPFGKPWLTDHDALRFSASARGGWALLAVADGIELGADLEHEHTATEPDAVAREFLSPIERAAIAAVPPGERRRAFALAWARHESLRKLHGTGIGEPLPVTSGAVPVVVRNVRAPEHHVAAVAARSVDWGVRVREFASELAAR